MAELITHSGAQTARRWHTARLTLALLSVGAALFAFSLTLGQRPAPGLGPLGTWRWPVLLLAEGYLLATAGLHWALSEQKGPRWLALGHALAMVATGIALARGSASRALLLGMDLPLSAVGVVATLSLLLEMIALRPAESIAPFRQDRLPAAHAFGYLVLCAVLLGCVLWTESLPLPDAQANRAILVQSR